MSAAPLEARELGRDFGRVVGLDRLDLVLQPGEVFGLVGLNGAGKSTALRLGLGLLRPTRGEVRLFGEPARAAVAVRRDLGFLPSELPLYRDRSGRANLDLLARLGGRTPADLDGRRVELATRLGLSPVDLDRPVGEMSHGMRQKVGLLQALEHEPRLVLLDEPSDGLDPVTRRELNAILAEIRDAGATILLASHVLSEMQEIADRVGVLHRGRLVALETAEGLRRREAMRIEVSFRGPAPAVDDLEGVSVADRGDRRLVLHARPPLAALIKRLGDAEVDEMIVREPTIDDLVRSIAAGGER